MADTNAEDATLVALRECEQRSLTLGEFIAEVTRRHAERPALAYRGASISFSNLYDQVRAAAQGLLACGVTKGTRVAILMPTRPEWVVAAFAVGMIGGVIVPVSTFATAQERHYVLRHSDSAVLLLQASFLKNEYLADVMLRFPSAQGALPGNIQIPELPYLRRIIALEPSSEYPSIESWEGLVSIGRKISVEILDGVAAQVHPSDDAMLIYTSGSTSLPKGVMHMHRGPCLQSWRSAILYGIREFDRVLGGHPLFWTAGFAPLLGAGLAAGACLILQELWEPGETLALIERERVSMLRGWPHQMSALGDHPDAAVRDLSSIRALPPGALRRFIRNFDENWKPSALWGLTETFTNVTYFPVGTSARDLDASNGFVQPGMMVRIVDPQTGTEVPAGTPGEILVKGITFMRSYYKMLPEEYLDSEGFLHTKDSGFIDKEGHLHWIGRLSVMIKTKGANVSPVEVENELLSWGRLQAAFVVGIPDPVAGELVIACVLALQNENVTEAGVKEFLKSRIAAYKVPARVLFFSREELPMTATAKIQPADLRAIVKRRLEAASDAAK